MYRLFSLLYWLITTAQALTISSVGLNGSGCPLGSFTHKINQEQLTISASFNNFTATSGTGVSIRENRKNCQITYGIQLASDEQVALRGLTLEAVYGAASSDVILSFQSIYYFQGQLDQAIGRKEIKGPLSKSKRTISTDYDPKFWSPCGKAVVLNAVIDVRAFCKGGPPENSWGIVNIFGTEGPEFITRKCVGEEIFMAQGEL